MKRNVYLILITVITILCIIAGTGYHLVRFGLSVAEGLPSFSEFIEAISDWDDDGDDSDDSDDNDDSDNGISTSVDASQKNLDAFSSINADLNVVDLTIQRGNTFSITCKASKKLTPEYKVENNCLTITQYAKAHNALGRNKKCSVTITVADTLTDLKLHTNVGDVDLSGLNVLALDLRADVGDIDLENCTLETSTLDANVGDIDLEDCTFTSMEITSNVGDVDLDCKEDLSGYHIELGTGVGDVNVNDTYCHRSYSNQGGSSHSLTIANDTGDISLTY